MKIKERILTLNELTDKCGYFKSNNAFVGYGCSHKECGEVEHVNKNGDVIELREYDLIKKMTKRNIRCNKRLVKKFYKKAKDILWNRNKLKQYGYSIEGGCFSFSCPIAWEADYEDIKDINDYDHIKSDEEMPYGFGEELMIIYKNEKNILD